MHARQPSGYGHRTHGQESGARRGRVIRGRLAATARVDAGRGSHRARRRGLTRAAAWSLLALAATLAVPAYAQTTHWQATLTVGRIPNFEYYGYGTGANTYGSLSDTAFTLAGTRYSITSLYGRPDTGTYIVFAGPPAAAALAGVVLRVGSHALAFSSATFQHRQVR